MAALQVIVYHLCQLSTRPSISERGPTFPSVDMVYSNYDKYCWKDKKIAEVDLETKTGCWWWRLRTSFVILPTQLLPGTLHSIPSTIIKRINGRTAGFDSHVGSSRIQKYMQNALCNTDYASCIGRIISSSHTCMHTSLYRT